MSQAICEKFGFFFLNVSKFVASRRPSWDAARGLWVLDGAPVDPQPAAPVDGVPLVFFAHQADHIGAAVPPAVKVTT